MRFQCENCHQVVAIDDSECGQPVGCGHCGSIVVVPQTRFSPNALINDFVVRSTLGSGGMGTVYLAHQLSLDRPVALKILMEQFAHNSEFIIDFVREARAAARLNHPNIVQSYAVGEEDGIYFFAMEYVEGKTFKTLLNEQGKIPWEHVFSIIQQIAEALDFAWKNQQLVHRDIKPDNIMLTNKRGVAKLADLGLARAAHETMDDDDEVMGTPQYICPEQLLGQPMDVRGDIYSLGATLFHGLTGNFPYEGNSAAEIARKHLNAPVPDPRDYDKSIPESASFVVKKMMAKRLEDRYEDAEELVMDIAYVLRGQKPAGFKSKNPSKKSYRGQGKSNRPTGTNLKKATMGGGKKGKKGTGVFKAPASPKQQRKPGASQQSMTPAASQQQVRNPASSQSQIRKPTATKSPTKAKTKAQTNKPIPVVSPPSPPSPPQRPTSGDSKKMTKSSTGQVKSKTLRSTRSRTSTSTSTSTGANVQDPASGNYRRPGTRPPKSGVGGKIALAILILGILAMIGCIVLFIIQYVKYNFKTTELAKKCYLNEKISSKQRQAYNDVAIYFDESWEDKKAPEVLKAANHYLKEYPKCIFSREEGATLQVKDYVELYDVPLKLNMLAENIHKKAAPLIGQIRIFRDNKVLPRVELLYRMKANKEEDEIIRKNEAVNLFNKVKAEVEGAISSEASSTVQRYQKTYSDLQSKISSNQSNFASEKKKVLKKLISMTTMLNFNEAENYLAGRMRKEQEEIDYPASSRVTIRATTAGREDYMKKATPFLREQLLKFAKVPEIGGKMTFSELQDQFKTNAQSGVEAVQGKLRSMKSTEQALFEKRNKWYNDHKTALSKAVKYYFLVANTGTKYAEGWSKRKGIKNRSNIGDILRHYGWHPRRNEERPGDQIWIERITKNKLIVQIRRYDNEGVVARVGVEEMPLWEAHNHGIFHDVIAVYPKVRDKLSNFEECHSCFEFYVRPSMFEAKGGGSTNFLQGELPSAKASWNPDWGKTYIDIMIRGIRFESSKDRRIYLKKRLEKILKGTPVLGEKIGNVEDAVNQK